MNQELKPCPHCNARAELHRFSNREGVPYSAIVCGRCGELFSQERRRESAMIKYWNNTAEIKERIGENNG